MRVQVTVLVPTNAAMLEYRGNRGEEMALNHLVNAVVLGVRYRYLHSAHARKKQCRKNIKSVQYMKTRDWGNVIFGLAVSLT